MLQKSFRLYLLLKSLKFFASITFYLLIVKGVVGQEIILPFWNGFIPKVGTWEYCKNYCIPENFVLFVAMQCNKYNAEGKNYCIPEYFVLFVAMQCNKYNAEVLFCDIPVYNLLLTV